MKPSRTHRTHSRKCSMLTCCNTGLIVQRFFSPRLQFTECQKWWESTKYSKWSFRLPESLAAGAAPQDSLGQWTLSRDSEHPCQTEAVRASITSSSFSPLPWHLGAHLFQRLWLTHSKVLGSEGNKGIAPSCRAGWVCRLP